MYATLRPFRSWMIIMLWHMKKMGNMIFLQTLLFYSEMKLLILSMMNSV